MKEICLNNNAIEAWVADKVGTDAWDAFLSSTKTDIVSAVACFKSFIDFGESIDYSCAIIPVMKALEYELRIRFYDPYVRFLSEHYSAEQYADSILPDEYKDDHRKAAKLKYKIVQYDNGLQYVNANEENQFSLGNFCHSVRTSARKGNRKEPHIDRPFIEYCSQVLFAKESISNTKLRNWIINIVDQTERQIHVRNSSAHGAEIQNQKAAERAIREVVTSGKLLAVIVKPTF